MIFYLSFKIFLFINYCKVSELLRKVWRSDQKLSNYEIFALFCLLNSESEKLDQTSHSTGSQALFGSGTPESFKPLPDAFKPSSFCTFKSL